MSTDSTVAVAVTAADADAGPDDCETATPGPDPGAGAASFLAHPKAAAQSTTARYFLELVITPPLGWMNGST
jgi:hypothetical protein